MALAAAILLCVAVSAGSTLKIPACEQRSVLVELFEWKWTDVAAECRTFLGPRGYCAVQVSPPTEHAVLDGRAWWERYQPVSYALNGKSGSRQQFQDMVDTCNAAGVRVITEVVLNNMAAMTSRGQGHAGSSYDAAHLSYPAVPYDVNDFNNASLCAAATTRYNAAQKIRNCPMHGLSDLDQSRENVRTALTDYLNQLVDLGVTGFSVSAAGYMWPSDLKAIEDGVKHLPGGERPAFIMDVRDTGDSAVKAAEYADLGFTSEYRFAEDLPDAMKDLRKLRRLVDYSSGMVLSQRALVFVDTHVAQRFTPGGTLTFQTPREFTMATAFALAFGYGTVRLMSSYDFSGVSQGPPMDAESNILDVDADDDGWCLNGWMCEHRWGAISDLVPFHDAVQDKDVNHVTATRDLVAFTRGRSGFFAMTSRSNFTGLVQTGMAPGVYCEEIYNCSYTVRVDSQGRAVLNMSHDFNPILAILNPEAPENKYQRTVIFLEKNTEPGEYVFFRGGLDHSRNPGCTENAESSACAIPIQPREENLSIDEAYDAWPSLSVCCTENAESSACAIPIQPREENLSIDEAYDAWRQGDEHLDWYGKEGGQGDFGSWQPSGSPGLWTTNDADDVRRFHPLNSYGSHYWMLDMDMDCSKTDGGFFEVKGYLTTRYRSEGTWESNVYNNQCRGSEPYAHSSSNHVAKCGSVNVFRWGQGSCETRDL